MDEPQVSFREEEFTSSRPQQSVARTGFVTRAVISLGLAADEKQAQNVLLYIAAAALVLGVSIFFWASPKAKIGNPPPVAPASQP